MAATKLSFATFNLYNLNLPGEPMYRNTSGWTQAEYDLKRDWTARMLGLGNADVWGFQEHWHNDALNEAIDQAGLSATHTALVPPGHAGGMIQCAGLVRSDLLVDQPEWITEFPEAFRLESEGSDPQTPKMLVTVSSFSRPVLRFTIKAHRNKRPIVVYVAHLKSKLPTALFREGWYNQDRALYKPHQSAIGSALSTIRRTAEATALRIMLTEHLAGETDPVVVLGDLNDGVQSNTLSVLTEDPTYLLDGRTSEGSDRGLYSVATLQRLRSERDVYYSHIYGNRLETLDHILVSEEFYDLSRDRQWGFKGVEIINDHLNRDDHKESGTSDHGIVRAEFAARSSPRMS